LTKTGSSESRAQKDRFSQLFFPAYLEDAAIPC